MVTLLQLVTTVQVASVEWKVRNAGWGLKGVKIRFRGRVGVKFRVWDSVGKRFRVEVSVRNRSSKNY